MKHEKAFSVDVDVVKLIINFKLARNEAQSFNGWHEKFSTSSTASFA
jgi:hypothetical protein